MGIRWSRNGNEELKKKKITHKRVKIFKIDTNVDLPAAGPNKGLPSSSIFSSDFPLQYFLGCALVEPVFLSWLLGERLLLFLHACVLFFLFLCFGFEARVRERLPGNTDLVHAESIFDGYNGTDIEG